MPHNIALISLQDCHSDHQDSDHIPMQGLVAHDKHTAPVEHTTSYLILCTRELFFNFFNALSLENFILWGMEMMVVALKHLLDIALQLIA